MLIPHYFFTFVKKLQSPPVSYERESQFTPSPLLPAAMEPSQTRSAVTTFGLVPLDPGSPRNWIARSERQCRRNFKRFPAQSRRTGFLLVLLEVTDFRQRLDRSFEPYRWWRQLWVEPHPLVWVEVLPVVTPCSDLPCRRTGSAPLPKRCPPRLWKLPPSLETQQQEQEIQGRRRRRQCQRDYGVPPPSGSYVPVHNEGSATGGGGGVDSTWIRNYHRWSLSPVGFC
jgi:hypothetical protein